MTGASDLSAIRCRTAGPPPLRASGGASASSPSSRARRSDAKAPGAGAGVGAPAARPRPGPPRPARLRRGVAGVARGGAAAAATAAAAAAAAEEAGEEKAPRADLGAEAGGEELADEEDDSASLRGLRGLRELRGLRGLLAPLGPLRRLLKPGPGPGERELPRAPPGQAPAAVPPPLAGPVLSPASTSMGAASARRPLPAAPPPLPRLPRAKRGTTTPLPVITAGAGAEPLAAAAGSVVGAAVASDATKGGGDDALHALKSKGCGNAARPGLAVGAAPSPLQTRSERGKDWPTRDQL